METTLYEHNGNYFNESEIDQHKEIYEILSYIDEHHEQITLMQDFEYFRTHNSYRVILKSSFLNPQIFMKLNKSKWEMNYLFVENEHLVIGLRPCKN